MLLNSKCQICDWWLGSALLIRRFHCCEAASSEHIDDSMNGSEVYAGKRQMNISNCMKHETDKPTTSKLK
jgi:hypothetical protein